MTVVYKPNPYGMYALYKNADSDVWKESASITNQQLKGDECETVRQPIKKENTNFCD